MPGETSPCGGLQRMSDVISVLVVDDEEDSRGLLTSLLETLGYRVEAAGSGQEALGRLSAVAGTPDLVVLDVVMPGVDGMETLRRYREAGGRQPVIMVSGLDEAQVAMQAMRLGASEYITKPFNPEELREVMER